MRAPNDRYRLLLDIGRTLSAKLALPELYRAIHRETARVVDASGFYVVTYDPDTDAATIVFYSDGGEEQDANITFKGSDMEVLRTGESVLVRDRTKVGSLMVVGAQQPASDVTRSAVCVPLRHYDGRIVGALSAQSYRVDAYGPDEVELLQSVADMSAVAIENARFVQALEEKRREAEQVEEIGRVLTSSLDTRDVLDSVVGGVLRLMKVDGCAVWLFEDTEARVAWSGGEIELPTGTTWDLSGELYYELVEERRHVIVDDLEKVDIVPEHLRTLLKGGSGIAVPLVVEDRVLGALTAGSKDEGVFDDEAVRVLERIARQTSVALENARLHSSLEALSLTDPLTGLPNRRHLQLHLQREVAAARRGRQLAVVMFDLDNFKETNDSLGHVAGDDALRAFGRILAEENRKMNLVARFGGDEFTAVLSGTDLQGAAGYMGRVRRRVRSDAVLSSYGISATSGAAVFDPNSMRSMDDIMQAADAELYRNKQRRRTE